MILTLVRYIKLPSATVGMIDVGGHAFHTLEPGWKGWMPFKTCLPLGVYPLALQPSVEDGQAWYIKDTPGCEGARFKAGAIAAHSDGCIMLGYTLIEHNGEPALYGSKMVLQTFNTLLRNADDHSLVIMATNSDDYSLTD